MKGYVEAFGAISGGKWVTVLGFLTLAMIGVSTGYTQPNPYVQIPIMLIGTVTMFAGIGMIFYRGKKDGERRDRQDERRRNTRHTMPRSDTSYELAKKVHRAMTETEIANNIEEHPRDAAKNEQELRKLVVRLRLREEARRGGVVFYEGGLYHPRGDATVLVADD